MSVVKRAAKSCTRARRESSKNNTLFGAQQPDNNCCDRSCVSAVSSRVVTAVRTLLLFCAALMCTVRACLNILLSQKHDRTHAGTCARGVWGGGIFCRAQSVLSPAAPRVSLNEQAGTSLGLLLLFTLRNVRDHTVPHALDVCANPAFARPLQTLIKSYAKVLLYC